MPMIATSALSLSRSSTSGKSRNVWKTVRGVTVSLDMGSPLLPRLRHHPRLERSGLACFQPHEMAATKTFRPQYSKVTPVGIATDRLALGIGHAGPDTCKRKKTGHWPVF